MQKKSWLFVVIFIAIILGVWRIGFNSDNSYKNNSWKDTSWAVDKACAEVKSDLYSSYGEIPTVSGEVIYTQGQNYIVAVKYTISGWKWQGSCACLVYGYSKDNCHVSKMTKEMTYDYNYKANIEELKALWALT